MTRPASDYESNLTISQQQQEQNLKIHFCKNGLCLAWTGPLRKAGLEKNTFITKFTPRLSSTTIIQKRLQEKIGDKIKVTIIVF